MSQLYKKFKDWSKDQETYVFSGCVEEKYPAIKESIIQISKLLEQKFHTYSNQTCCSGPLTKMGLGNGESLKYFTKGNNNIREHNEKIMLSSCNGCYSYMIKSKEFETSVEEMLNSQKKKTIPKGADNKIDSKMFLMHSMEYLAMWAKELQYHYKYKLSDVTFVVHYGCHYINQYDLGHEKSFRYAYAEEKKQKNWLYNTLPTYLQDITKPLGATINDYNEEILCCGGSTPQRQINNDNAIAIANKKFTSVRTAEPDAILTNCPLCMLWLEESQFVKELEEKFDKKIPLIHINELLGILLDIEGIKDLVTESHKVAIDALLEKIIID